MKYINTAFGQLAFAWKLYNYALENRINIEELDKSLTFQDGDYVLALQYKIFDAPADLILALQKNLTIVFGAAAITLNRCREEIFGERLNNPIVNEIDQFSSVVYQIRNAFAHDIAEPKWKITSPRYIRVYEFGGIRIDLREVNGKHFEYKDIGGPDMLFQMKKYADKYVWPDRHPE
jgi:hypothetical protein